MRLGLLTDIHEHVDDLKLALAACDHLRADRIICLGDVFETGKAIDETVALLAERGIAGVWGNHDFGLCYEPRPAIQERYSGPVLNYMTTYRPRLEIGECLFTHVEPWLDTTDLAQLWYFEGPPDTAEKAARSFAATDQRVLFTGHMHRWLLATRQGPLPWTGREPIRLVPPERYLVVVAAVCEGYCAIYDTDSHELTPITLRGSVLTS
jgi:predicted phosphodiesterase